VYDELVAPLIGLPPLFHWYVGAGVPFATTLNVTLPPAVTVWFAGCVLIVGALEAALTVSVATFEVTLPAVFVTTTV